MTATIFTYPPDYVAAGFAARALREAGVRPVLAIDRRDPPLAVEGVQVVRTDFPRGGNLNGKASVLGQLETMLRVADGDAYQLKVDSDTLVLGTQWLEGRTETAVGFHHPGTREFYGFAYALRTDRLRDLVAAAEAMPRSRDCPEDVTMARLAGDVHRYANLAPGCPAAAWKWEGATVEEYRSRYEVVLFQFGDGNDRPEVREAMRGFFE